VFFHVSDVAELADLQPGQRVQYDMGVDKRLGKVRPCRCGAYSMLRFSRRRADGRQDCQQPRCARCRL
jgi:hypothetical protein